MRNPPELQTVEVSWHVYDEFRSDTFHDVTMVDLHEATGALLIRGGEGDQRYGVTYNRNVWIDVRAKVQTP